MKKLKNIRGLQFVVCINGEKNRPTKNEFGGWKPQTIHAGGISVDARPKRATQAQLGTTEATEHLHRNWGS